MKKKGNRRQRNLFVGISAGVLMLVAAGLLMLSYISTVANPAKVWFFSIFGLLFFPIAILNIVLLIWAAVRRSRLLIIPLLAVLPSLLFAGRYIRFGNSEAAGQNEVSASPSASVRLLTWNVDRFSYRKDRCASREACADSIFAYLRRQNADIICLQEYVTENPSQLKSFVSSRMPGYHIEYYLLKGRGTYCGNMTLSRLPAVGKGKVLFEDSSNLALYSDYSSCGRKFRIYNCHFESYAISMSNIWKSVTGDREILQKTENKYRRSIIRRPKQVNDVLAHIEESPIEALVCGDFNDNPMSYTYHRISHDLKDTFVEAGCGFGASYSAFWPMLRIDYVFIPQEWHAVSHITDRVKLSDHYPVVTDLVAGQ